MQQVFSDRQTVAIQFLLTAPLAILLWWAAYRYGAAPNYGGFLGFVEAFGWYFISTFTALTLTGTVLWGLNLLFYQIQTYRHGSYVDNVTDDQ